MFVKFAALCDKCERRSEEYSTWPTCRECGEHVCPQCDVDNERTEDERDETLCLECHAEV